jgi:hypothetical protein
VITLADITAPPIYENAFYPSCDGTGISKALAHYAETDYEPDKKHRTEFVKATEEESISAVGTAGVAHA